MDAGSNWRFEAALAAWGATARIEGPLGGGNRNDIRAARVGDRRYAARLSRRPAPALDWELDLLEHLHGSGMRVPLPLPAGDGRRHVAGLVVLDWLEGDAPASAGDWRAVAAELDRLHRLTRDWPQRPGFHSTRALLELDRGGDVRLDLLPPEGVDRCRDAWRRLAGEPCSVVHGDPGPSNILISGRGVGLIDWDEARVDRSILDFADLPLDLAPTIGPARLDRARRAADAWEAANGWLLEPEYARGRLARLG